MAQPFDVAAMRLTGEAFQISAPIAQSGRVFSVSANGVLVYRTGDVLPRKQLAWFDRTGRRLSVFGEPADYGNPTLAPDGKRIAISRRDPRTRNVDIWLFDVEREDATRLTFDPGADYNPVFSSDGKRIFFSSIRKGSTGVYSKAATGIGDDEALFQGQHSDLRFANDASPDGRFLIYDTGNTGSADLWLLPLAAESKPVPFLVRPFIDVQARISSDGRWIAYSSNESGRQEVYVQDFPTPTAKWRVSTAGGGEPMWRADGKEIFFLSGRAFMAADVQIDGPAFRSGVPRILFETDVDKANVRNRYVVSPDGQRFLVVGDDQQAAPGLITVVVNWRPSKGTP
jgi:Tol biopolymer transport system component